MQYGILQSGEIPVCCKGRVKGRGWVWGGVRGRGGGGRSEEGRGTGRERAFKEGGVEENGTRKRESGWEQGTEVSSFNCRNGEPNRRLSVVEISKIFSIIIESRFVQAQSLSWVVAPYIASLLSVLACLLRRSPLLMIAARPKYQTPLCDGLHLAGGPNSHASKPDSDGNGGEGEAASSRDWQNGWLEQTEAHNRLPNGGRRLRPRLQHAYGRQE